jgi:hypothetical protein
MRDPDLNDALAEIERLREQLRLANMDACNEMVEAAELQRCLAEAGYPGGKISGKVTFEFSPDLVDPEDLEDR